MNTSYLNIALTAYKSLKFCVVVVWERSDDDDGEAHSELELDQQQLDKLDRL